MFVGPGLEADGVDPGIAGWWRAHVSTSSSAVLPDGGVDVIWTPGRVPWIAGPDTKAAEASVPAESVVVGVRLRPGAVSTLIGADAPMIVDQRVALNEVLSGCDVRKLGRLLHEADLGDAPRVLAKNVGDLVGQCWKPDPMVSEEILRIESRRPVRPGGSSRRQLRRRFTNAMGYGPKFYERIHRINSFIELATRSPLTSLGQVAADVGYHDQSHVARDARLLTGRTPAQLAGRHPIVAG